MEDVLTLSMDAARNEAIEQTVRKERKRLFEFIRKRVPETEDAEDILQDVFYQLTNNYWEIGSLERIASWMFTVARNRITDTYRKKKPEPVSRYGAVQSDDGEERLNLLDLLPDLSGDPEEQYLRALIWEKLEEALEELPESQRRVFELHELEDRSFKEIAAETGEPLGTLISRKHYAVVFIRKRLRKLYEEFMNDRTNSR